MIASRPNVQPGTEKPKTDSVSGIRATLIRNLVVTFSLEQIRFLSCPMEAVYFQS